MIIAMASPKPRVVAVLGPERLVLFRVSGRRQAASADLCFEHVVDAESSEPGWTWLEAAAAEAVAEGHVATDETLDLVLLRPLVSTRALALPPCRRSILLRLLSASRGRYFARSDEAVVIDAWRTGRGANGERCVVAACAAADTVSDVSTALLAGGLTIRRVLSAPLAVARAAQLVDARLKNAPEAVAAAFGDCSCELIRLSCGEPTSFVPTPLDEGRGNAAAAVDAAIRALARVEGSQPLAVALGSTDAAKSIVENAATPFELGFHPGIRSLEALAAVGAVHLEAEAPDLSPYEVRARRDRSRRWRTIVAVGVACVATFTAAQLHLLDLRRELHAASYAREVLAPTVEDALRTRSAVQLARTVAGELAEYERRRSNWTAVIADLASALPVSIYVTRLEATSDSVAIAGQAADGIELPVTLRGAGAVDGVRLVPSRAGDSSDTGFEARFAIRVSEMIGPLEETVAQ